MKRFRVVVIILIIVGIIIFTLWNSGTQAPNSADTKKYEFVVNQGESIREIANKLKKQELIKDPVIFFLLVKKLGLDNKIQAGDFRISPSMTTQEVAEDLVHGSLDAWIVIPEGQRADEIADTLKQKIPTYNESWRKTLEKNEGYLFPDSYLVPLNVDIDALVSLLKKNFDSKFTDLAKNKTSFSTQNVIVVASLVEREARFEADRPLVAAVIYNRLKTSMPVQIDATIQYALGYQSDEKSWWKKKIFDGDLKIDSPYNTYINIGLPPTPICNPGLSAIKAALRPADTEYLFYVSDKDGHNHYAKTLEEHNENIKKYSL